jgi:hypothetical protein
MYQYTFRKDPLKQGEYSTTYGQSYWSEVNEQLEPVKFNSQDQNIGIDDKIECEEREERTSTKGTKYYQLKKVKVISGSQGEATNSPAVTQASQNTGSAVGQAPIIIEHLGIIEKKIDLLQETLNKPNSEEPY